MGVVASLVGLFLGLALAKGLFELFDAVGFTLPNSGLLFQTRTIVVSLLLGIIVTLIASVVPGASRDARAADRRGARGRDASRQGRFARFRTPVAGRDHGRSGSPAARSGACSARASTPRRCSCFMIVGTLLVFIGVALLSAPLIPRFTRILGWPATRIGGAAGVLARDNARRNPQRTASTAAALMIGLALVTLVATLAAGITQTFRGAVNDMFTGDYAITAQNNFSPIPIDAAEAAAQAPGVIAGGQRPHRGGACLRLDGVRDGGRRPGAKDVITLDWVEGSQEVLAGARATTGRSSTRTTPRSTT